MIEKRKKMSLTTILSKLILIVFALLCMVFLYSDNEIAFTLLVVYVLGLFLILVLYALSCRLLSPYTWECNINGQLRSLKSKPHFNLVLKISTFNHERMKEFIHQSMSEIKDKLEEILANIVHMDKQFESHNNMFQEHRRWSSEEVSESETIVAEEEDADTHVSRRVGSGGGRRVNYVD
jgi:c-di-AMP phosphodiesterase-like protein